MSHMFEFCQWTYSQISNSMREGIQKEILVGWTTLVKTHLNALRVVSSPQRSFLGLHRISVSTWRVAEYIAEYTASVTLSHVVRSSLKRRARVAKKTRRLRVRLVQNDILGNSASSDFFARTMSSAIVLSLLNMLDKHMQSAPSPLSKLSDFQDWGRTFVRFWVRCPILFQILFPPNIHL
jgi:hypothetical protein